MRAALALTLWCALVCAPSAAETLTHGRFDRVQIHRPEGTVEHVVLLLSGDEGWTPELDAMATKVAAAGALVAGIDMHA